MYPKVPVNRMVNEDSSTKRICVSQSINGCLTAIGDFNVGDLVYIYECNSDLVSQPLLSQVVDRCFTGEQWILEPVKMKLFMTIVIIEMMDVTVNGMSNIMYGYKNKMYESLA